MTRINALALLIGREGPSGGTPSEHASKFGEGENIGQVSVHLTRNARRRYDILSSFRAIGVDPRRYVSSHNANTKIVIRLIGTKVEKTDL